MPTSLTVIGVTYTTATLTWMPPAMPNGDIVEYHLEYRRTIDSHLQYSTLLPTNNARNRTVTGLYPNTTYQFRVSAVTVVGRGNYTNIVKNTTLRKLFKNLPYSYISTCVIAILHVR